MRSTGRPTDLQYGDVILQALPLKYDRNRQTYLERKGFGLADIRRIMAVIYADNLSRSESLKSSRDAAPQCRRWTGTALVSYVITATNLGISKESAHSESNSSSSSGSSQFGTISNNNMVNISKRRADGGKITVGAAEALCGVHIPRQPPIMTPTAVPSNTKPAATLMRRPPELSASKECTAPMFCPRRMTIQDTPTSPSWQPRYKARQSQRRRRPGRRTSPGRLVH